MALEESPGPHPRLAARPSTSLDISIIILVLLSMGRRPHSPWLVHRGRNLAQAIKRAREASGLSQADVAHRAKLSVDAIRQIEQERVPNPTFFTVVDIAAATGTTVADLLDDAT